MSKTDLIDQLHHEHAHLTRLFSELAQTFAGLAVADEVDADLLSTAADDLQTALDEMLHHFSQEEEILFIELARKFPEMRDALGELERNHESITTHTRWLLTLLGRGPDAFLQESKAAIEAVEAVSREIKQHTMDEARIYGDALRRLGPEERRAMMEQLQQI